MGVGLEAKDVAVTAAAFLGAYLGQLRTRRTVREAVAELLRPRLRRYAVALATLGRRVRLLEQRAEPAREA